MMSIKFDDLFCKLLECLSAVVCHHGSVSVFGNRQPSVKISRLECHHLGRRQMRQKRFRLLRRLFCLRIYTQGAVMGGFWDTKRSRLQQLHHHLHQQNLQLLAKEQAHEVSQKLVLFDTKIADRQSTFTRSQSQTQQLERQVQALTNQLQIFRQQTRQCLLDREQLIGEVSKCEGEIEAENVFLQELGSQAHQTKDKMMIDGEMVSVSLEFFETKLKSLTDALENVVEERLTVDRLKGEVEVLVAREQSFNLNVPFATGGTSEGGHKRAESVDLDDAGINGDKETLRQLHESLRLNNRDIEVSNGRLRELAESIDTTSLSIADVQLQLESERAYLERYMAKRHTLMQQKEEYVGKIRMLGALPDEAFDKFNSNSDEQVFASNLRVGLEILCRAFHSPKWISCDLSDFPFNLCILLIYRNPTSIHTSIE